MLARAIYSLLLYLCLPAALGYFAWRSIREPEYRRGWGERLGFGDLRARGGIWVHAASVGEVQAAVPLVQALAEDYPDQPLLVTVFTPTGRERAEAALAGIAQVRYLPLDLPGAVRRFLRSAAPSVGVIVETEIWPNLLAGCRRSGVPVMFANGRLSENSARHYAGTALRPLIGTALAGVARVAAASSEDAQRFVKLGVPADRVTETGNLKFDMALPEQLGEQGLALRRSWQAQDRPVLVAASTHEGEEAAVLDAFERLREEWSSLLLVLVPRHPQRFDTVAHLLATRGIAFVRRSDNEVLTHDGSVILADTLGELLSFYAAADVTFVGGSLAEGVGGHNLLEPAALGVPMLVGPHLGGWKSVADALAEAGALRVVNDAAALASAVADALEDEPGRRQAGAAAQQVVAANSGALARTRALVSELLASPRYNPR